MRGGLDARGGLQTVRRMVARAVICSFYQGGSGGEQVEWQKGEPTAAELNGRDVLLSRSNLALITGWWVGQVCNERTATLMELRRAVLASFLQFMARMSSRRHWRAQRRRLSDGDRLA